MLNILNRTTSFAGIACILTLTAAAECASSAQATSAKTPVKSPASYTFRFAPALGRGPIETLRQTTILEAAGRRTTRVTTVSYRTTSKAIANGYRASVETISVSVTENGKAVRDKVLTDIHSIPYTMDISKDGQLLRVHGHEKTIAQLRDATSPAFLEALGPAFSKAGIEQRVRAEWDRRIGDFAGESVKIGEIWEYPNNSALGDDSNTISWTTRVRFAGTLVKAGRTYMHVKTHSIADSDSAAKWMLEFVSRIMQTVESTPVDIAIKGLQIVETGERLIHPSTMMIAEDRTTKRVSGKITADGETFTLVRTDKTEYRLALAAPKPALKKAR